MTTLQHMVPISSARVQADLADVRENEVTVNDVRLLSGLSRTVHTAQDQEKRLEAYDTAVCH